MTERSFWGDYANRSKRPAPRPALYNRLTRDGAPVTQPKKKPGANPVTPIASAAATLGIKPAIQQVVNAFSSPPTPTFAETPFGPTATPVELLPEAGPAVAPTSTLGGSTPILGVNPAAGPAAAIVATLPSWKEGFDKGSASQGFKDAPFYAKGAGFFGGAAGNLMGNGRHPDDIKRKGANEALRSSGFLDQNYGVQVPGGDKTKPFNIGEDELIGAPNDRAYNLDMNDPANGEYIGAMQPLVDILLPNGNDEVARGQMTSKLVNAARSSPTGDVMGAIKNFYAQANLGDRNSAYQKVIDLSADAERLPPERRDAYLAAIDKLFGVPGAAKSGGASIVPQAQGSSGGSSSDRKPPPLAVPPPPVAAPPPVPGAPDVNFPQAIADVYANNTSDPVTTLLNPVTAPPFTPNQPSALDLQPLARRRRR